MPGPHCWEEVGPHVGPHVCLEGGAQMRKDCTHHCGSLAWGGGGAVTRAVSIWSVHNMLVLISGSMTMLFSTLTLSQ